jgi:antitoxin CptB
MLDNTRKKLLYRANHRGTREMDFLMGQFAASYLPTCDDSNLNAFENFLELQDLDLYAWKMGTEPRQTHPDSDMERIIALFIGQS